ncbi:MAG TPA: hypothetical protein VK449_06875 [Anaerolineales bacterium]|nr:hypothetical protein [Anaerolineales bacterium]
MRALATAFDRMAARPYLVLPALALDLFLWLGPRLNLASVFNAVAASLAAPASGPAELANQVAMAKDMLTTFGAQFNLFSALSTFPVGVPSLMSALMPSTSPLGEPRQVPLSDPGSILLAWIALTVVGLGMASLYHAAISRAASQASPVGQPWMLWLKVMAMAALTYFGLAAIAGGSLVAASLVTLITPFLGTGVAFLGFTFLFWLAVYLVFTPHGLIRYRLGLLASMRESVRIVRRDFFPVVGLLATLAVLSWVTGLVWELPAADSWFGGLAILGHAFVSAVLLVASYIFYVGRREALVASQRPPAPDEAAVDRRDARGA